MTSDESLRRLEHRLYHGDNNAHTAVPRSDGDGAEKARPAQRLGRHGPAVERMRRKGGLPELTVRPCCLLSAALAESLQLSLHFPSCRVQTATAPTSRTAEKAQRVAHKTAQHVAGEELGGHCHYYYHLDDAKERLEGGQRLDLRQRSGASRASPVPTVCCGSVQFTSKPSNAWLCQFLFSSRITRASTL